MMTWNRLLKMIKTKIGFFVCFVFCLLNFVQFCWFLEWLLAFKIVVKLNVKYYHNDLFLTTQNFILTAENTNDFRRKGTTQSLA